MKISGIGRKTQWEAIFRGLRFSEDGDDVLDFDNEKPVVAFEIDGDRTFGIEQDLVVLTQGNVGRILYLRGDRYDPAGNGGDFDIVRQLDAAFGLLLILVLTNEHTFADRLDDFQRPCFDFPVFIHSALAPEKRPISDSSIVTTKQGLLMGDTGFEPVTR